MKIVLKYLYTKIKKELENLYSKRETESIVKKYLQCKFEVSLIDLLFFENKYIEIKNINDLENDILRLKKYEPLAYVLGYTYFDDLKIYTDKSTLIPRPETEELVDIIKKNISSNENLKVLDICSGGGCISIALKKHFCNWEIEGFDISADAIKISQKNSIENGVDIKFFKKDLLKLKKLKKRYNIIISNPPYVLNSEKKKIKKNVLDYEPYNAIFVSDDEDPLLFYKKILDISKEKNNCAKVFFEINPLLVDKVYNLMCFYFRKVDVIKDMQNKDRFIFASWWI